MNPEDFILPDLPSQHSPSNSVGSNSRKRDRSPSRDPYDQPGSQQKIEVDASMIRNPMWYRKYEPTTTTEIGTANAKIKEVDAAILNSALYGKLHRILLLAGPSGTGKSTLVKILCKQHGFELTEWLTARRSFGDDYNSPYVRPIDDFRQFINQCIYFNSFGQRKKGRVILLDDLPDLTTDDVKRTFHQILQDCLEISRPFLIVMVVSDSVTDLDSSKSYEKRTNYLNDVLPSDLREGDTRIKEVKFNGMTIPVMRKILKNIAVEENLLLPATRLEQIIQDSDGDIRLAINTLQFQSIPTDSPTEHSKGPPSPIRRAKDGSKLVEFDEHVGHLSLFHAIGKVIYAKRDTEGNYESTPEHIINKIPVDNDTFISYVHQNCIKFFKDIDDCAKALTELSDADTIRSEADLQDKVQSVYRNYVSIHGIMKNTKTIASTGKLRQLEAVMFKRDWELKRLPQKANYEAWLASAKERAESYEEDHPMNMREIDPIEPFSSDEDGFDEIFGDGSELADLDY